ncbi:MAG: hypothetical protein LUC19_00885 [Oscillospiraceae bacterium]|nr:hypothetical protein [Oscillospiraceae bacterium]
MGKSSQKKGRKAELELAGILRGYGFEAVRAAEPLNFGNVPDLVGLPNIHIECKRCEQQRLAEWVAQAVADSEKFCDGAPTIFHRRNRGEWLASMRLVDWVELYKCAYSRKID